MPRHTLATLWVRQWVHVREVQTQSEEHMIETHDERSRIPDLNAPVSDDDLGYERIEENSQIMLRRV